MGESDAISDRPVNKISVFLFGTPRILWNGMPVAIDRHKAVALLAVLCVEEGAHHRDSLASLLWPDFDLTRGRAALRRVLASLTGVLPGPWWKTDRDNIAFCAETATPGCLDAAGTESFWLDLTEFRTLRAVCLPSSPGQAQPCSEESLVRLSRAVELYRGDFMEGFSLTDSAGFDDWQMAQAEALRQDLTGMLARLVRCHTEQDDIDTAVRFCKRWVQLDPLDEAAQENLMRLYLAAGKPNAAMHQFQSYRKTLESELGVAPQETITSIYETLVDHRFPKFQPLEPHKAAPRGGVKGQTRPLVLPAAPTSQPARTPQSARKPAPSLPGLRGTIGRDSELERADMLWQKARAGEAAMLLVSGEPGIGKTHLVRQIARQAAPAGAVILQGECYSNEGRPYAPLAQPIEDSLRRLELENNLTLLDDNLLADLMQIAPSLKMRFPGIPQNPRLAPVSEQQRIFDNFFAFFCIGTRVTGRPHLLMIEDAHWADASTLQLLRYLVRRAGTEKLPLLVVITFRNTEANPETGGLLQEMEAEGALSQNTTHIALQRLEREPTHDLVDHILEGAGAGFRAPRSLADAIYEQTEGNPFFVQEVCRLLYEEGRLPGHGGQPEWVDGAMVSIPVTVRTLILSRVGHLSQSARQMLQFAAFLGRHFDLDMLAGLTGLDEETLIGLVEEAAQAHLIQETRTGSAPMLTFAHQLIPYALRENLSEIRRRREHQRVAQYLETHCPEDLSSLAFHFSAAEDRGKAVHYAHASAREAMNVFAFESALHYLRGASDMLETMRLTEQHLDILEDLADVHRWMGNHAEAVAVYQEALEMWFRLPRKDPWKAARLNRKIGETITNINQFAEVQRLSATARSSLASGLLIVKNEAPHPETVRLLAVLSRSTWYMQSSVDWDAAEQYARQAVETAEALGRPEELAIALEALANVYGVKGLLRERVEVCLRRLALSYDARFSDLKERVNILLQTSMALYDVGEYLQSLGYLIQVESLARQIMDVPAQADALTRQGQCLFRLDRWDELLAIEPKVRQIEKHFTIKRMGLLTCFLFALHSSVRYRRGEDDLGAALKQEAYDVMVAIGGPPASWVRNQHF